MLAKRLRLPQSTAVWQCRCHRKPTAARHYSRRSSKSSSSSSSVSSSPSSSSSSSSSDHPQPSKPSASSSASLYDKLFPSRPGPPTTAKHPRSSRPSAGAAQSLKSSDEDALHPPRPGLGAGGDDGREVDVSHVGDELRAWLEDAAAAAAASVARGQRARDRAESRGEKTVLVLCSLSRSLAESDFYRWAPQGRHVAGWAGGISKVVQAVSATTREPRGQYFLFFDTRSAAEACAAQLDRVYDLTEAADLLDPLGWKCKVVAEGAVVRGWDRACWFRCACCCCACCSRNLSTRAARVRSSMVRGETMVTVFFSFLGCSGKGCGGDSNFALDGDERQAGEVLERVRPQGGANDVVEAIPAAVVAITTDCRFGVWGKSENAGDFTGWGEVALRGLVFFSSVAWRRSNKEDLLSPEFNTPLNMTLYRSSLMSGISTLSNPVPLAEAEEADSETVGAFDGVASASVPGSAIDLTMMGLCFGVFLLATVLLRTETGAALDPVAAESWVGLPSAIPIGISPDLADGCRLLPVPMPMPVLVRAMSSLEIRLSQPGFTSVDLLEFGPEDVLGRASILNGAVLAKTAMALDGGGGRGRSSVLRRVPAPSACVPWTQGRI
ncbi:uncharacterized protein P884DRAFT_227867 [Thermothelomyces heterothallicus CBS 202.75]|uniref:uncharacterized protein n=1 Tax=Thermothelomyces heterothallicus CBS 202.75 TaxID=1149848 RepID=UPI003743DB5C